MTMNFNCSNLLKSVLLLSIMLYPTFSIEFIHQCDVDNEENWSVEKVAFQVNMKRLANNSFDEDGGDNFFNKLDVGAMEIAEFSKKEDATSGFLDRYRYQINLTNNWDSYMENGKSIDTLKYTSNGAEVPLCNEIFTYGLVYHGMKNTYLMSIYKLNGWQSLEHMIVSDEDFKNYMADPANRMQFYLDLATMWKTLIENKKRICLSSPDDISIYVNEDGPNTYTPMFRFPEMSVGLSELCHDYDALVSSKSVIEKSIENTEMYQSKIEVFNLGRLIFFIETLIGYYRLPNDSEGNDLFKKYAQFEVEIREEREANEFSNAKLKEEKAYLETELLNIIDNQPYLDESQEDQNASIKAIFVAFFTQLKTTIRKNNMCNGRPTFSDLIASYTANLQSIQEAKGERRRNVLLV